MVNNMVVRILVTGSYVIKPSADGRQRINNGPIFDLESVKRTIHVNGLMVVNDSAEEDMQNEFDPIMIDEEIPALICSLDASRHYVESELCRTTRGFIVDCDAYRIKWNRKACKEWEYAAPIYIKFGYLENQILCLVTSIHPSKY